MYYACSSILKNSPCIFIGLMKERWSNQEEWDRRDMWHVWGRNTYRVLIGTPEGRRPLGRPRSRWENNTKMDLQDLGWGAWTWSIWLRTETGSGLLWMWYRTIGFHKMRGSSWLAEDLFASLEGLCYMQLVRNEEAQFKAALRRYLITNCCW
jgi:hypothetical protein